MNPLAVSGADGLGQTDTKVQNMLGLAFVLAIAWWVYRSG